VSWPPQAGVSNGDINAGEMEDEPTTLEPHLVLTVDNPGLASTRERRDDGGKEVA